MENLTTNELKVIVAVNNLQQLILRTKTMLAIPVSFNCATEARIITESTIELLGALEDLGIERNQSS